MLLSFFSLKNTVNKEKGLFFFHPFFFHGKSGFVCVAAYVEDFGCSGSKVCCFLILITGFCVFVFMNMDFKLWILNVCETWKFLVLDLLLCFPILPFFLITFWQGPL